MCFVGLTQSSVNETDIKQYSAICNDKDIEFIDSDNDVIYIIVFNVNGRPIQYYTRNDPSIYGKVEIGKSYNVSVSDNTIIGVNT